MTEEVDEKAGDLGETQSPNLPAETVGRPAELTTFVAALVLVAANLGLDLSTELVLACFVVLGALPGIVSWYIDHYRSYLR